MKSAAVFRCGAYGDLLMASSVLAGLKQQGYETTLYCTVPACILVEKDPNIDHLVVLSGQEFSRPNEELHKLFNELANKHEKFINLSESIEGQFLALPGRVNFAWPYEMRKKYMDGNFLEFAHELAGIPHIPQIKFYPTTDEIIKSNLQRNQMPGKKIVVYCIGGSSLHKVSPHMDQIIAEIMLEMEDVDVVLVGNVGHDILCQSWVPGKYTGPHNERVHIRTNWSVREMYTFTQHHADLVIGPETGLLVGMSGEPMGKIVLLSHSSVNNLTRDWKNTISLEAKNITSCKYKMVFNWGDCSKCVGFANTSGVTVCQQNIDTQEIFKAMRLFL